MNKSSLNSKGISRSINLSQIYGTLLTLIGLVVPMTEALRGNWLSNHLVACFLAYLYTLSCVFIIYLVTYEEILRKRQVKEEAAKDDTARTDNFRMFSSNNVRQRKGTYINEALEEEDEEASTSSNELSASSATENYKKEETNEEDEDKIEDLRKQIVFSTRSSFFIPNPSGDGGGVNAFFTPHPISIEENTTEAIHDYLADHMETSTLVSQDSLFFVKGGSLLFAMANIIYISLLIQGSHLQMKECDENVIVYPHYLHLFFIILQTYIMLKKCKHSVKKNRTLTRFGLTHLIATNLCVWLRFLMLEVTEAIEHGDSHAYDNSSDGNNTKCTADTVASTAGHYLFPFVLEYSLVAMSSFVFLFMSTNIRVTRAMYRAIKNSLFYSTQMPRKYSTDDPNDIPTPTSPLPAVVLPSSGKSGQQTHEEGLGSFSKSHKGLFSGVLLMSGAIVSMVLFFYYNGSGEENTASLCYTTSETIMLFFLFIACILGMVKLSKFDVDINNNHTFDHILLLSSASLYVILYLFELVSAIYYLFEGHIEPWYVMNVVVDIMALFQCGIQTMFILDGMQREATDEEQRKHKYGRGVITFLIVGNVAAWVFKSFQDKEVYAAAEIEFYGSVAWAIIHSVAFPLVLFFKFHSSICLAHMWHHCYETEHDNIVETKMYV